MNALTDLKLLIFDLDGTIVRLTVDWEKVREKLRKRLGTNLSLTPLIPSLEGTVSDLRLRRKAYRIIDEEEMKAARGLKVDEEIVVVFEKIKRHGYKIALVTLQGRTPAIEALRRLRILEYFDLIISRDEEKDREGQIELALKNTDTHASQALLIADKLTDMTAARELGCLSVAVTEKSEITADYKVANIKGLLRILEID